MIKSRKNIIALLFCLIFLQTEYLRAQDNFTPPDTLGNDKIDIYEAVGFASAYYAGSMYILSKTWYNDRERVPFHFYNDNSGYLQVDKLGHTFGAYVYSYIGYHFLLNSGFKRKDALLYGATLGLILQTPIEIMDGIYEGFGFSWGDMAANTIGSALVLGQELVFKEQIIKYKFSYWESPYAEKANGFLGTNSFDRIFNDYNGHTYWLSCPINKIFPHLGTPDWLSVAVGYGANGMYGEFENISEYNGVAIPKTTRYRQYFFSLDIDWTRIKTDSKLLQLLFKSLTFVKLPFPAIEFNSKGELKGYYLYY